MAWRIELDKRVQRMLKKIDKQTARRIIAKLREISLLEDPRSTGKALVGNVAGLWRYRVGDYRILCLIDDDVLVVLVVDIGHRRGVYR
ncbi:type II toxin-antitoxin system RelE/ParE family toxin [Collinsella sp. AGMB00827]|uniref:Type II toxin-antitoxin system RelE/ParE family toxin n=1 Tax=Collinsella ureilytica TaxID=2869515 RepID=A0ABS7MK47_9ACTN|nr:type II toxin-antitoxin system RelE/ParE family toxin [Collinsella urealyticum]MBY4797745.1 type II toxin-antitoxin system RelE/ParE family toxin [Collinsella urealyticum]